VIPGGEGERPGTPTGLEVSNHDGSVTLSWTAPEDEGVTDIDYYVVYQDGEQVAVVEDTSVTVEDLENGVEYLFTVAAHNSAGIGPRTSAVVGEPIPGNLSVPFWAILILLLLAVLAITIVVVYVSGSRRAERKVLSQRTQQYPNYPQFGSNMPPQNYGPGSEAVPPIDTDAGSVETSRSVPTESQVILEGAPAKAPGTLLGAAPVVASDPLSAPKFCMNCGSPLSGEGSFCSNCGSRVR
jgi:hypothetical protein